MLGRSSNVVWEGSSSVGGQRLRTPVHGIPREPASGAIRAASTAGWHGPSDSAAPLLGANTLKEGSAPAVLPIDVSLKKRSSVALIAVVATLTLAAGIGGLFLYKYRTDEEPAKTIAPAAALSKEAPVAPGVAGEPATTPKTDTTPTPPVEDKAIEEAPAVEVKKEPEQPRPVVHKDHKPRIKKPPVVETKPPEKKPEGKEKVVDPPPEPKPRREDLYSRPHPTQPNQ
jgi:hypothetical protein